MVYLEMTNVLHRFVKTGRTGNSNCNRWAYVAVVNVYYLIYPQKIETLCDDHPDVYANFINGFHVVLRRSGRYCAGLSTDLIIEQVLMRSIKTSGGLTQGKGLLTY